jgi:hypothetical protein
MHTKLERDAAVIQLAAEMNGMCDGKTALRVLTRMRECEARISELEIQLRLALDMAAGRKP